ncbi:MAG: AI-2E family transporter [Candidatus Kerfeldbacteria bacterium]|nr:AI-2E family transporter [Candidatus Kerfeldbacteria bacterium]
MVNIRKQPFFYALIVIVAVLAFIVVRPLLTPVVLAFLTALFFKPVYEYFHHSFGQRTKLASFVTVMVVIVAVVIPLSLVIAAVVNQIILFNNDLSGSGNLDIRALVDVGNNALDKIGVDYRLTVQNVQAELKNVAGAIGQFFVKQLPKIGSGAANFMAAGFIYVVVLFSLFPAQRKFFQFIERLSPMDDRIDQVYLSRIVEMSRSMVKGTFLIAFVQALVSSVFLVVAGVDYILFWMIIMMFIGIIPMLGATVVVLPIAVVLLLTGDIWQGLFLIGTNILVVSNLDNYLRPKLVSKKLSLHPALVLIGVLGGLQVFGILGFIYGPVIMILLVTTIELYLKYFKNGNSPATT